MPSPTLLRLAVAVVCLILLGPAVRAEERPNVILILADDLGWKDAGFRGSKYYETPRLDAFANESVEFTRAYACPSCAPSRAALLTGQYSPRTGVFMVGASDRGNKAAQKLVPVPNREELPEGAITMAEALRRAGYATAIIGKWHLGEGASEPERKGFEVNIAAYDEGTPPSYFSPYGMPKIADGPTGQYLTDRLTHEAIKFIEKNKERPFFLYLPHYAVHVPIQAKEELERAFKDKPADGDQRDPAYAAMIKSLDENVGRLLDALDQLGLADKTHVVFTSDNGGQLGITAQPPLREGKGWLYEGGIRVPFLVRSPGTKPGRNATAVHLIDLYPTILEWAGVTAPEDHALDGISLAKPAYDPAATLPARDLFWHFPGYQPLRDGFRIRPSSVIMSGPWKLTEKFEDGSTELYDLESDPGETKNVADERTEVVADLKTRLASWRETVNAPIPSHPNPAFQPAP